MVWMVWMVSTALDLCSGGDSLRARSWGKRWRSGRRNTSKDGTF
jgi:hypothetical protein